MSTSPEKDGKGESSGVAEEFAESTTDASGDALLEEIVEDEIIEPRQRPTLPLGAAALQTRRQRPARSIPPPLPANAVRKTRTDQVVPIAKPPASVQVIASTQLSGPSATPLGASKVPGSAPVVAPVTGSLVTGQPESPTVLDRALGALAETSKVRADQLAKELEAAATTDRTRAASLAYELGELYERKLHNDDRALFAYRRALELDRTLRPNRWALRRALYRRGVWPELERLIDSELEHVTHDAERVDLLFERALVSGRRKGADEQARTVLTRAAQLAPHHQGVLFELERLSARGRDRVRLVELYERLAEAIDQPERKIAYWLEVARATAANDNPRATRAFAAASQLAAGISGSYAWRTARERLRLADIHGTGADIAAALDSYAQALVATIVEAGSGEQRAGLIARQRELAALRRRQAQFMRADEPLTAWASMQEALALCPDESVVLGDLVELAAELGRYKELVVLVAAWRATESDAGLVRMLSAWCADARLGPERREQSRALLGAVTVTAPGFILLTSAAECDALADTTQARVELASIYLDAARAANAGTWVGPGSPPRPDRPAAAALCIQAAELYAHYVAPAGVEASSVAIDQARAALDKALEMVPGHPAAIEAMIELDDISGSPQRALARCQELAAASPKDRGILERALRVAVNHDVTDAVIDLERRIVALDPSDGWAAWRLQSTLAQLGVHAEDRVQMFDNLARSETDPARKHTALLGAARLHERAGDAEAALTRYRELRGLCPHDAFVRDAYSELLRTHERWEELVTERLEAARSEADGQSLRRALRESAWVLEVRLDDAGRAAEVYEEWLARLPQDRTALEGIARCRAALRDPLREVAARATIAELDQTAEAEWLYARSLERAGRDAQAIEHYQALLARDETSVAVAAAAVALGELTGTSSNLAMRIDAAEALAKRTSDPQLGAALFEQSGWMRLIGLADPEPAVQAFASALAVQPGRRGAVLGTALAASRRNERVSQGDALAELATAMPTPDASAALLLRASVTALASGDLETANARIATARTVAPEDNTVIIVGAEARLPKRDDSSDPFAAVDHVLARAELLVKRIALSDDPASRIAWELDRAEALENAGDQRHASGVLATVLDAQPNNRRALAAVRRIARNAGDHVAWAQASYALARLTRDPALKLRLLRDAASVYDHRGRAPNMQYLRSIFARIIEVDPTAPESERLLEMLREQSDRGPLINALSDQLTHLASVAAMEAHRMVPLLLERATLLREQGHNDQARADLDAVLAHAPAHLDALRLRADLAVEAGDLPGAIELWRQFLAVELTGTRRIEIEKLMVDALDKIDDVVPPPPPSPPRKPAPDEETTTDVRAFEDENGLAWELEFTKADAVEPAPPIGEDTAIPARKPGRRTSHVIRRVTPPAGTPTGQQPVATPGTEPDPLDVNTVTATGDPFGANTATADLTRLQEEELRLAQAANKLAEDARSAAEAAPHRQAQGSTSGAVPRPLSDELSVPRRTGPHTVARPRRTTLTPAETQGSMLSAQQSMVTVAEIPSSLRAFADEKTASTPPTLHLPKVARVDEAAATEPVLDARAIHFPEERDLAGDESAAVLLSVDQLLPSRAEDADEALRECERELTVTTDPASLLELRLEASRLAELAGDAERARVHYDAALVIDGQCTPALRGLRRLARERGDLLEATRLLDTELAIASPREREALERYRVGLLLAAGEHDLARVAVGALLDRAPSDLPILLAELEVSLADHRAAELRVVLERLAASTGAELRAALQCARAVLADRDADSTAAGTWFTAAAESDPSSPALRLEAIRDAAARGQGQPGVALLDLAYHVEREDPITAAALAIRSQSWVSADSGRETLAAAAQLAARAAARDPLVGRIAAETALVTEEPAQASHAFVRWSRCKSVPAERAFAAARAAELDPARLGRLWSQVLDLDAGDDYATARLRAAHVSMEALDQALELDLQTATSMQRDVPLLRAVRELVIDGQIERSIDQLRTAREHRPTSWAIAEALADLYAVAERWSDRGRVLGELVAEPGLLASDVVRLRAALAWDRAARTLDPEIVGEERERATQAALDAWNAVLADDPRSTVAHAAAIWLAGQVEDPGTAIKVLARARAAERSPWGASSLSLRYGRMLLATNPRLAQTVARDLAPGLDDPRSTLARVMASATRRDLGEAVSALEDRATQIEARVAKTASGASHEPAMLRLRAAHLALDAGDMPRAKLLLSRVEKALPALVDDLLEVARQRAGDPSPTGVRTRATPDSFARTLRDADQAAARGDAALALLLYQRALALRPADTFAAEPLVRIAFKLRAPAPMAALAREHLRIADESGDALAKADAYELLGRVEELRGDAPAALAAFEQAVTIDPARHDLQHQLACDLAASNQHGKLLSMRLAQLEHFERAGVTLSDRDRIALLTDTATLAIQDKRNENEIAGLYRGVLGRDPANRIALLFVEATLRRAGTSVALAGFEEHIATTFEEPRSIATFLTRAGETLAEMGEHVAAVTRFVRANELAPDYLPALISWHDAALAGELWAELAEAATRRARLGGPPELIAHLHHLAGVALMDKAKVRDGAVMSLRDALAIEPQHLDALLRLRILLEHTAEREVYAEAVRSRLQRATDRAEQVELHRMLAEHHRNVGELEDAVRHYRAMLAIDPADVRAHAAIADAATDPNDWSKAADAVIARIPLERDVQVLRTLHARLGALYAEHDAQQAIASLERALAYRPDDEDTLIRLTDLAIHAKQWDVAVGACDRLVTSERDPEKLALHLHRAATIFFRGFTDRERAERMVQLAVDSAPASTDNLKLLVQYYNEVGDPAALRGHLDRIADLMRSRIEQDVRDPAACRMLARTVLARDEAAPQRSVHVARASAELAQLLGGAGDVEQRLLSVDTPGDLSRLVGPGVDDELFADASEHALRELFRRLAEPLTKYLGVDLANYGVGRKERLPAKHPTLAIVRAIGTSLGFKDVEVYVSSRHPHAMVAEPSTPVSLVLGEAIAGGGAHGVRFAAGAALKLAQLSLAIPARLSGPELAALAVAVLRLFHPDFTIPGVDLDAVQVHLQKLRRHVSASVLSDARPFASSISAFHAAALARDLKIAGLRAGLAASGSLAASLAVVAGAVGSNIQNMITDPIGRALITFAFSEPRTPP